MASVSRVLAPPPQAPLEAAADSPRFSIVITAYEAAETIAGAVGSALDQTLPAHEVIVVDDGSSDKLADALEPFGERITLVRKPNGGGASARNAGAAAASGEFMAILDADDTYEPGRIEALSALARERPDLDLLATDAGFVIDGVTVGTFLEHNAFPTEGQRQAIFESCFPSGWPAVRLSALTAISGFDEEMRIAYDWDCWLRMILHGSAVGMIAEPLYNYVLHGGSLASGRSASLRERVALLAKAERNPDLRPDERRPLEQALRRHRTAAARAALQGSLEEGGSRSASVKVALSGAADPRTRVLALLAAASPALVRRRAIGEPPPERRFEASAK
jgi:hypothetical protein